MTPIAVSSNRERSAFEKVSLQNALILLRIIDEFEISTLDHIHQRYSQSADNFNEVAKFLEAIGIVQLRGDQIEPGDWFESAASKLRLGDEQLFKLMIDLIIDSSSLYAEEFVSLVERFQQMETGDWALAKLAPNDNAVALRNMLIEVNAIDFDHDNKTYFMGKLLQEARFDLELQKGLSPEQLEKSQANQARVGLLAEEIVFEYEKCEAGGELQHLVRHIAKFNVSAGYDVYSVRPQSDGILQKRFIEVKAVSPLDWRFYWSKNERAKAEIHGGNYFLYLLPVEQGEPNIDNICIISDPFNNLLDDNSSWEISTDVIECRKK